MYNQPRLLRWRPRLDADRNASRNCRAGREGGVGTGVARCSVAHAAATRDDVAAKPRRHLKDRPRVVSRRGSCRLRC